MVLIMQRACVAEVAAFQPELDEAQAFVESDRRRVPCVDAEIDLTDRELASGMFNCRAKQLLRDSLPTRFGCDVHAPDKCLVSQLSLCFSLQPGNAYELIIDESSEDNTIRLRS